MVVCRVKFSRLELGFLGFCYLIALASAVEAEAPVWFRVLLIISALLSFFAHLRRRLLTHLRFAHGAWLSRTAELIIGQQFTRFEHCGVVFEAELPEVVYSSEFLLVLRLRRRGPKGRVRNMNLVLWPDSLARAESCRLRRYLRFELPVVL